MAPASKLTTTNPPPHVSCCCGSCLDPLLGDRLTGSKRGPLTPSPSVCLLLHRLARNRLVKRCIVSEAWAYAWEQQLTDKSEVSVSDGESNIPGISPQLPLATKSEACACVYNETERD